MSEPLSDWSRDELTRIARAHHLTRSRWLVVPMSYRVGKPFAMMAVLARLGLLTQRDSGGVPVHALTPRGFAAVEMLPPRWSTEMRVVTTVD